MTNCPLCDCPLLQLKDEPQRLRCARCQPATWSVPPPKAKKMAEAWLQSVKEKLGQLH